MTGKKKAKAKAEQQEIESKLKSCFFITPIGGKESLEFKKLEGLIDNVINQVLVKFGYELIVAHKIQTLGSINDQIFKEIVDADLLISNLTGLNPNVMYETAVGHSFGKPTIMICEEGTKLPFDLANDRTIFFDDTISGCGILIEEMSKKIVQLEANDKSDNPVYRVVEKTHILEEINKGTVDGDNILLETVMDLESKIDILMKIGVNKFNEKLTSDSTLHSGSIYLYFSTGSQVDKEYMDTIIQKFMGSSNSGIEEMGIKEIKKMNVSGEHRETRVILSITYYGSYKEVVYDIRNLIDEPVKIHFYEKR